MCDAESHDADPATSFDIKVNYHAGPVDPAGFLHDPRHADSGVATGTLQVARYGYRTRSLLPAAERPTSGRHGQPAGDPAKLAAAIVTIAEQENPPARFVAGVDTIPAVETKARELLAQADASRELGMALTIDDDVAVGASPRS